VFHTANVQISFQDLQAAEDYFSQTAETTLTHSGGKEGGKKYISKIRQKN